MEAGSHAGTRRGLRGAIVAGGEEAFAQVHERLEPIWRRFPHVQGVSGRFFHFITESRALGAAAQG